MDLKNKLIKRKKMIKRSRWHVPDNPPSALGSSNQPAHTPFEKTGKGKIRKNLIVPSSRELRPRIVEGHDTETMAQPMKSKRTRA